MCTDDAFRAEIELQRKSLLDFYTAAYNGDREGWSQAMQRALAGDANNPYFE
jgi:spermidine synthase